MIVEAAYEAYEDAGLEDPHRQIEAVFCGAQYPSKGTAEVADPRRFRNTLLVDGIAAH
jgi:acetyl-CoA C-acetyltransferase